MKKYERIKGPSIICNVSNISDWADVVRIHDPDICRERSYRDQTIIERDRIARLTHTHNLEFHNENRKILSPILHLSNILSKSSKKIIYELKRLHRKRKIRLKYSAFKSNSN